MAARRSSAKTARSQKKTPAAGKDSGRRKKAKAGTGPAEKKAPNKGKPNQGKPNRGKPKSKRKATSSKGSADKGSAKKKVTKKKATATKSKAMNKKKAGKKKAGKKKAGKKKAIGKSGRVGQTTRKTRTKAASSPASETRKAGKKKASKKKLSKAGPAKKKGAKGRASKAEGLDRDAVEQLDAVGVIERLQVLTHVEDDSSSEVSLLIERLDDVATEDDLPAMFGALTGDDTLGIQWSIFFIMERFDDHYLEALLEALPGLHERAPEWAQTAVIRVLNTRGEEDDCTQALEDLALSAPANQRDSLVVVLRELANDPTGDLLPQQRESIELTLKALGEEPPEKDPLQLAGAREG